MCPLLILTQTVSKIVQVTHLENTEPEVMYNSFSFQKIVVLLYHLKITKSIAPIFRRLFVQLINVSDWWVPLELVFEKEILLLKLDNLEYVCVYVLLLRTNCN